MSRLIAQLLLSVFVLPLGTIVYLIFFWIFLFYPRTNNEEGAFLMGGAAAWAFVILYWTMLWRKSVRWTSQRAALTLGTVAAALFVGGAVGWAMTNVGWDEIGPFMGSITAPIVWVVLTVVVWRETKAERAARVKSFGRESVVCPSCGYNLTGLTETRCPECGTRYTIDQLFAEQPGRAAVELES